jgi:hypothetical protein
MRGKMSVGKTQTREVKAKSKGRAADHGKIHDLPRYALYSQNKRYRHLPATCSLARHSLAVRAITALVGVCRSRSPALTTGAGRASAASPSHRQMSTVTAAPWVKPCCGGCRSYCVAACCTGKGLESGSTVTRRPVGRGSSTVVGTAVGTRPVGVLWATGAGGCSDFRSLLTNSPT